MSPQTVTRMESMLSEVMEMQKDYVAKICPDCPDPCCTRVSYLFCEKDILFLRLSGRKPVRRREAYKKKGCSFLGPMGCILDAKSRPFMCHRYICPDLEREMQKQKPGLLMALKKKIKAMDEMRSQMWAEYLTRHNPPERIMGRF